MTSVEDALRAQFSQLMEAAPNPLVIVSRDGKITMVNAKTEALFGYSRSELCGQLVEMLIPERYRAKHPGHRNDYFRNPIPRQMSTDLALYGRRKDGSELPIEISLSPIESADGLVVSAAIRDISERRLRDDARAWLSAIVDSSEDAIIGKALDGTISSWNHGAERIFGYSAAEALGQPITMLVPPDRADEEIANVQRIKRGERIEQYETLRTRKDGRVIDVSVVISPIRSRSGEIIGASKIARDITEHKKAEDKFRALLEAAPDAIVIANPDGRIELVNAQTERLFGYGRDQLIGQKLELLLPDGLDEPHGLRQDGSLFPVEVSQSPLHTETGLLILRAIRDVTAGKVLLNTLARRAVELEAANHELEAFSYSVSHDLRSPLRALDGFSQALLNNYPGKPLDDKGLDYLRRIRAASQRMGHLIDDLLKLSRLTRTEMLRQPLDLGALAARIADELKEASPGRQVTFVIAKGLVVDADPQLMGVALRNLIGNAWKFTSKNAHAQIEIGAVDQKEERAYFVRDDGAGFDMAYADQLFGVFQRLHSAAEFEGTGVGLATVQRVIARHGGRIWAEAAVGKGATFFFTL